MKRFFVVLTALFLALSSFAQDPMMQALPDDSALRVGQLENGLTYYIRHNDKPAQRAEFYLATRAGAIQETPDQDGLAHFLEHMCFNGLKNLPGKSMLEYLQSIGAKFGQNINASTGVEKTQYMLNNIPVVREGVIDTCLLIMHDYAYFVTNDPEEIDNERGVIIEEKRTRNDASWRMYMKNKPFLFGDTKYATCSLIGSEENLRNFKPESLVNFYRTWYRADNQAIIVVGDVDVDMMEQKIKTLFADIPAPTTPLEKEVIEIPSHTEPWVGVVTDPEYTSSDISLIFKHKPLPTEMANTLYAQVESLMEMLTRTVMAERFNDISSKKDAPFLSASMAWANICNTCRIIDCQVTFKDGEYKTAYGSLLYEIERLRRYGVGAAELERAKARVLSAYEKAWKGEEGRTNADLVRPMLNKFFQNTPVLAPKDAYEIVKLLCEKLITRDLLNKVLQQKLVDENISIIYNGPEKVEKPQVEVLTEMFKASRVAEVEAPVEEVVVTDLISTPLAGAKVRKSVQGIYGATQWTLANGVKVVVLPTEYKKDQVLMRLVKEGGSSLIPEADLPSFDDNILGMLDRVAGVGEFSGPELSKALSGKSVSVSPFIDSYKHGISGNAAPKDIEAALQLFYLYYTSPRMVEDDYLKSVNDLRPLLANHMETPDYKFSAKLSDALYQGHPRGKMVDMEMLDKASFEAYCRNYKKLFSNAAGLTLYIVGNVELQSLQPLVEKYIGSIPKSCCKSKAKDNGIRMAAGEVVEQFSVKMNTPKVTVCQVRHGYLPYSVAASVQLQAAESVLKMVYTEVLREKMGGTYGAHVSAQLSRFPKGRSSVQIFFDTNQEQMEAMSQAARTCMDEMMDASKISTEYFDRTLKNFQKNIPERKIQNSYWLSCLQHYYQYNEDFDALYAKAVENLTIEQVAQAFRTVCGENFFELIMLPAQE